MRKLLFIVGLTQFIIYPLICQELPLFATYQFDRYVLNPSYVAENGYSQVNLVHRRVWTNIDDAPVISGLNLQYALNPKIGLGFNFLNDQRILLSTNTAMATFGYRIFLSDRHLWQFGLSAGAIFNQLDLDDVDDSVDPALANLSSNQTQLQAQFGMSYRFKRFTLGITLPRLIRDQSFSNTETDVEFSEFDNFIANGAYKIDLSPFINMEPYGQYTLTGDDFDFFELGVLGRFKDVFTLGGFYRQERGLGFLTQVSFANVYFAYAFEDGNNQNLSFGGSTHELQLKLRLGKKVAKEPIKTSELENQPQEYNALVQDEIEEDSMDPTTEEEAEIKSEETEENEDAKVVEMQDAPQSIREETNLDTKNKVAETDKSTYPKDTVNRSTAIEEKLEDEQINQDPFYYLVVGVFRIANNADDFLDKIKSEYPQSGKLFIADSGFHYVYIVKSSEVVNRFNTIKMIRETTEFSDAWFMRY